MSSFSNAVSCRPIKIMKNFFLLLFLLPFSKNLFSQFPGMGSQAPAITGKISGTVIDKNTKEPVEFASVSIVKSGGRKILNGGITDAKGYFKIENIGPGTYTIMISFVGYAKKSIDSVQTTLFKPDRNLGKISLESTTSDLKEVTIEATAPIIENKVDRLVYNAEKDVTSKGGDASDVLRKVPMLNVDLDGNVELRGSSNVKVLINGKPSGMMASSVADALKTIPADQIKSVEVITSPSAKYDAEGSAGIINIITKKKNMEGTNGNINLGAGTRNENLNASLNIKKGRLGINFSGGGRFNVPSKGKTDYYRATFGYDTLILSQNGTFKPQRRNYNASIGLDYDINGFNNLSTNLRLSDYYFSRGNEVEVNMYDTLKTFKKTYTRKSDNPAENIVLDYNLDYKRTFKDPAKEFSSSLQFSQNKRDENYTLDQSLNNYQEKSNNIGFNREGILQTDYTLPVKKLMTIEAGGKVTFRNITSNYQLDTLNIVTNEFEKNSSRTDSFDYLQKIYAGYATLGFKIKEKYEIKTGIRYELTDNDGNFTSGDSTKITDYDNFFPNFMISRSFKDLSSIKFSYSERIQRPDLRNLNPFVNASDPRNISQGNPELLPEITHSYELSYGKFGGKINYNISAYYKHTTYVIQNITDVHHDTVSVNTYKNIGTSDNVGSNIFGQIILFKIWTLRSSANIYYTEQQGDYNGESLSNNSFQYNIFANSSWELGKNWTGEIFGMFNSPRITLQGKSHSWSFMNIGVKKQIWNKKGSIGVQVFNPLSKYRNFKSELSQDNVFYQRSDNYVPFRSFGISFSYSFGKMEFKQQNFKKKKKGSDMNSDEENQF